MSALIDYAEHNDAFAQTFAHHLRNLAEKKFNTHLVPNCSRYLVPSTETEAIREAQWLLQILSDNTSLDARTALAFGQTWAADYEEPKNLVFGIVGMAIIGPTLGLVSSKKKKKSAMRLIVDKKSYSKYTKKSLLALASKGSGMQYAAELKAAGSNALKLHPDTADWCFTDHLTEIYTESAANLSDTIKILESEKLPHTVLTDSNNTAVVVLSPSIDEHFILDRGAESV